MYLILTKIIQRTSNRSRNEFKMVECSRDLEAANGICSTCGYVKASRTIWPRKRQKIDVNGKSQSSR